MCGLPASGSAIVWKLPVAGSKKWKPLAIDMTNPAFARTPRQPG